MDLIQVEAQLYGSQHDFQVLSEQNLAKLPNHCNVKRVGSSCNSQSITACQVLHVNKAGLGSYQVCEGGVRRGGPLGAQLRGVETAVGDRVCARLRMHHMPAVQPAVPHLQQAANTLNPLHRRQNCEDP